MKVDVFVDEGSLRIKLEPRSLKGISDIEKVIKLIWNKRVEVRAMISKPDSRPCGLEFVIKPEGD